MPYFMRHYGSFADRVIVYDDESDDGTPDIVRAAGGEVRACSWTGIDDLAMVTLANQEYKLARGKADWVIWVDADEFIYADDMPGALRRLTREGVQMPTVTGYCMTANGPPSGDGQIYDEIKTGFRAGRYDKSCVVDPKTELAWGAGRHEYMVYTPNVLCAVNDYKPLKLLHYRWFGMDYCVERSRQNYARLSQQNLTNGLGLETRPGFDGPYSPRWYAEQALSATTVI